MIGSPARRPDDAEIRGIGENIGDPRERDGNFSSRGRRGESYRKQGNIPQLPPMYFCDVSRDTVLQGCSIDAQFARVNVQVTRTLLQIYGAIR